MTKNPTPLGADHEYPNCITIACRHCGSRDVKRDAYASWDDKLQCWVLANTFDAAICDACGGETRLVERWLLPDGSMGEGVTETDTIAYPRSDWKYAVANGDTELGYAEWIEQCEERDRAVKEIEMIRNPEG